VRARASAAGQWLSATAFDTLTPFHPYCVAIAWRTQDWRGQQIVSHGRRTLIVMVSQAYYRRPVIEIDTPRLRLRPLTKDDQPQFVELFGDPRVTQYLALMEDPMQPEWAVSALDRNLACWTRYGYGPFAAIHKETGRWVGKIGLMVHEDWSGEDKTEVGWQLDPEFWGRGLATEGGTAAIHHGFAELDLPRIISVTTPKNVASWRVMEKCGLKRQGTIRWRDVDCVWYSAEKDEWLSQQR
jgi:RimJ/RimL family protein N-acetyltransferase